MEVSGIPALYDYIPDTRENEVLAGADRIGTHQNQNILWCVPDQTDYLLTIFLSK